MRYKSENQNGCIIFAVAGTDVVSFGIDYPKDQWEELLGFAVERHDITENEKYFMRGFKVFKELFPDPRENVLVSTNEHPVQSFVWDDFTAKPDHTYEYFFYPVKGKPKFLRKEPPVQINVVTEALYTNGEHDIFFNRGVASSQEYARRFKNVAPQDIENSELRKEAYDWLARKLEEAFFKFIDRSKKGDALFGSFYEFHYKPALKKFKEAIDRGVEVKLIIDCKNNGKQNNSFPKEANLLAIKETGIGAENIIQRIANSSYISHNKFLIYKPKNSNEPTEVWTGSTNISEGGIFGQTNVGHWIKNVQVAKDYLKYWELLSTDPGNKGNSSKENKEFKSKVDQISSDIDFTKLFNSAVPAIIPVFSPRPTAKMLDTYFDLVDRAGKSAFITLAFGVNKGLKEKLLNNNFNSSIVFMLLEKKDAPTSNSKDKQAFIRLDASNNVYQAYGSYIKDPLYKWTVEKTTKQFGLNSHVVFVHTKFLLKDPFSKNSVIVTGSANFSKNSLVANDENSFIIKGNRRAEDIYFTEFNRLFNHYYYRSVLDELKAKGKTPSSESLFLVSDNSWTKKYSKGKLRYKRLQLFQEMEGAETI